MYLHTQGVIQKQPQTLFLFTIDRTAQYELQQPPKLHGVCVFCHQYHVWQGQVRDILD